MAWFTSNKFSFEIEGKSVWYPRRFFVAYAMRLNPIIRAEIPTFAIQKIRGTDGYGEHPQFLHHRSY
jgi:hypothetical protein